MIVCELSIKVCIIKTSVFHVLITFSRYDFSFNHVFSCSVNFLMAICSFCLRFCLRFSCFGWNFSAIAVAAAAVAAASAGVVVVVAAAASAGVVVMVVVSVVVVLVVVSVVVVLLVVVVVLVEKVEKEEVGDMEVYQRLPRKGGNTPGLQQHKE